MDPVLLRPEECADALRVSRSVIYQLLRSGELQSVRIGASRRIPSTALNDYVERLEREIG